MSIYDPIEWKLYDPDLVTVESLLPAVKSHLYMEISEPGSGQVVIPLDSTSAGLVESAGFLECRYRGSVRGGFFAENIRSVHVNAGEGGGRMMSISGRGAMALMDDAVVWDDGSGGTKRIFTAQSRAATLIDLIEEAQARGALLNLSYSFSDSVDSDSVSWTESEELEFPVGMSLLDVVRQIAALGTDFTMTSDGAGGFELNAYKNGIGTDLSNTIFLRTGVNCTELVVDEVGTDIKNAYAVKYGAGFTNVSDATSITNRRRREKLLNTEYASNSEVALTFGQAELTLTKDPITSITLAVSDDFGHRLFEDYGLGDTITLDRFGVTADYRIRAIDADWDGESYANIVLNLNSLTAENRLKLNRNLKWLMDLWTTAHDAGQLDISFWASLNDYSSTDAGINAAYIDGDDIYLGGAFTRIGGISASRIVRYNVTNRTWHALGAGLTKSSGLCICYAITKFGSDIIFGGIFDAADGVSANHIAAWNGSTFSALGAGMAGGVSQAVRALDVDGTYLYAGGFFVTAGGVTVNHIARWNGSWSAMGTGIDIVGSVRAVLVNGADVYIGGNFTTAGGVTCGGIAKWNGSTWSDLDGGMASPTQWIYALNVLGDYLYAGGFFGEIGGVSCANIAVWHLTNMEWSNPFGDGMNDGCQSLTNDGIKIYAGGAFTEANGVSANRIVSWDGARFFPLGDGLNEPVGQVLVYLGDVYAAGGFTEAGGKTAYRFAVYLTNFQDFADYLDRDITFDLGSAIHNAIAKTTLADADEFPHWDSISGLLRKITKANLRTSILSGQTADRVAITNASGLITTKAALRINPTYGCVVLGEGADNLHATSNEETLHILGETASPGVFLTAAGTSIFPFITGQRLRGDLTTPTATQADDILIAISGRGYSNMGVTGTQASIRPTAAENWLSTNLGTKINFYTTPLASTTLTLAATINPSGGMTLFGQGFIDGAADQVQLRVQGHSTQTANLATFESSAGVVLGGVQGRGTYFCNLNIDSGSFFIGQGAGNLSASGATNNTAIGTNALAALTNGDGNVAIGASALINNTVGSQNFGLGTGTLRLNIDGNNNVAIGYATLYATQNSSDNIAIGNQAMYVANGAARNVAIGSSAFGVLTTGDFNVGIGYQVSGSGTTAAQGVIIGYNAHLYNQTGTNNVVIGYEAGLGALGNSNSNNVIIGHSAGRSITSGGSNIYIGYNAGYRQTNLSNRLIVDNQLRADAATEITNAIFYGVMASTPAAQTMRINAVTSIIPGYTAAGVNNVVTLDCVGSGAAGDGGSIIMAGKTSTALGQTMGAMDWRWIDATHASKKAAVRIYAYDTAARLGFEVEASGSAPKISFYGGTPVVRGAALTAQLTSITHTAPATPDYAIQDFVDVSLGAGWAFANHDEANSLLSVVANLQTRVAELEARLGSATGVNLFA
jgi:hypothetical protein